MSCVTWRKTLEIEEVGRAGRRGCVLFYGLAGASRNGTRPWEPMSEQT